jgi:hypothetical protein
MPTPDNLYHVEFRFTRCPMWINDGFEMRVIDWGPHPAYALPIEMRHIAEEEQGIQIPPMLTLDMQRAQQLCDALWEAGVRPTNGAGSVGQLAATERHLEDMRTLAFREPTRRRATP